MTFEDEGYLKLGALQTTYSSFIQTFKDYKRTTRSRLDLEQIEQLEATLETDPKKPTSWRKEVGTKHNALDKEINELQLMLDNLREQTQTEFQVVKTEAKQNFDKLIADARILDSVRVLAGFVKEMKV